MNLLLVRFEQIEEGGKIIITGRQAKHLIEILKVTIGSTVNVGIENVWVGSGYVIQIGQCNESRNIQESLSTTTTNSPQSPKRPKLRIEKTTIENEATVYLQLLHSNEDSDINLVQSKQKQFHLQEKSSLTNAIENPSFTLLRTEGHVRGITPASKSENQLDYQANQEKVSRTIFASGFKSQCLATSMTTSTLKTRPMIDLLVALPRPRTFDKVLQSAATMGVGRIIFTPSSRVEISYFSSPKLSVQSIQESLKLGLEQAADDPFFPEIVIYASWQRCLEQLQSKLIIHQQRLTNLDGVNTSKTDNSLPEDMNLEQNKDTVVESHCHPTASAISPSFPSDYYHSLVVLHPDPTSYALDHPSIDISHHNGPILLAFGPEGGFLDFEIAQLEKIGFRICHMGNRVMRVETAVVAALAQVQMLMSQNPNYLINTRLDLEPSSSKYCWCCANEKRPPSITLPIKGRRDKNGSSSSR